MITQVIEKRTQCEGSNILGLKYDNSNTLIKILVNTLMTKRMYYSLILLYIFTRCREKIWMIKLTMKNKIKISAEAIFLSGRIKFIRLRRMIVGQRC